MRRRCTPDGVLGCPPGRLRRRPPVLMVVAGVVCAMAVGWMDPGRAQQAASTVGGGGAPVEVLSDNGIEWRRDAKMYVARGNAVAIQGDDRVRGDVLLAHYRDAPGGGTEIWRMEARGGARIETPDQVVTGQTAIYEIDSGILVVRGAPLRLENGTDVVTATDSLEYWSDRRMAVARGQARLMRANGHSIEADVLAGYFGDADAGGADAPDPRDGADRGDAGGLAGGGLDRMEAFGDVVIATGREVVRGDRAVYDVPGGVATVIGDVTISTEADQLAGDRAVMNLETGVSSLLGGPATDGDDGRARALISPRRPDAGATPE